MITSRSIISLSQVAIILRYCWESFTDGNSVSELNTIWDEAKGHIEQGNYEKAIEIYRYILVRYSDNDIAAEYTNAYLGDAFLSYLISFCYLQHSEYLI